MEGGKAAFSRSCLRVRTREKKDRKGNEREKPEIVENEREISPGMDQGCHPSLARSVLTSRLSTFTWIRPGILSMASCVLGGKGVCWWKQPSNRGWAVGTAQFTTALQIPEQKRS
jgi:hypothetical protein